QQQLIPSTPGCPPAPLTSAMHRRIALWRLVNPYVRLPILQELTTDSRWLGEQFKEYCSYDSSIHFECADNPNKLLTLDACGIAPVARGKCEYLPGALHPIYPQVRAYWMDWVRFCIDRGADGVNFRVSNHSDRSHEQSEYG